MLGHLLEVHPTIESCLVIENSSPDLAGIVPIIHTMGNGSDEGMAQVAKAIAVGVANHMKVLVAFCHCSVFLLSRATR
jgi:hypothetical protein